MRRPQSVLIAIVVAIAATVGGCTSSPIVSVAPVDDGSFKTTVRAETEQLALSSATGSARETCRVQERQPEVIDTQVRSLGLPGRTEDPAQQAADLARYAGAVTFPSLSATDDFEVLVRFRCINYAVRSSAPGAL